MLFVRNEADQQNIEGVMLAFFIVLTVLFGSITVFLGSEFLKKFAFMRDFIANSNQMIVWHFRGLDDGKPGMRNVVLRGKKPFCALVGFKLNIPLLGWTGFDYYGFVQSDDQGVAVISTYLGKGHVEFQLFLNMDLEHNPVLVTSEEYDQHLRPHSTYPPPLVAALRLLQLNCPDGTPQASTFRRRRPCIL